jgi:hypothetical protein
MNILDHTYKVAEVLKGEVEEREKQRKLFCVHDEVEIMTDDRRG